MAATGDIMRDPCSGHETSFKTYSSGPVTRDRARRGRSRSLAGRADGAGSALGSGKSTLLKHPRRADHGQLRGGSGFRDLELTPLSRQAPDPLPARSRGVRGFQFYNLRAISSRRREKRSARHRDLGGRIDVRPPRRFELVGLGHRIDHFPLGTLSGRRAAAASPSPAPSPSGPEVLRVRRTHPAALDSKTGVQVLEVLPHDINASLGTTHGGDKPTNAMIQREKSRIA